MSLSSYAQRVRPFALLDKLLKPDLLATASAVKYICFLSFVLAGFDFMIFLTYKGPEGRAFMAAAVLEVLLSLLGIYACFTFHYRAATAYAGCLIIREAFYLLLGIVVVSMINEDPKDAHQSWKYAAAFIQFIVGLVSAYYGYIFWRRLRAQGPPLNHGQGYSNVFVGDQEHTGGSTGLLSAHDVEMDDEEDQEGKVSIELTVPRGMILTK
ncbi:hypothetical protein QOT17_020299 [Balamuthia mandrillaris]